VKYEIGQHGENQEAQAQRKSVRALILEALTCDGAHHKQWYLEQIAAILGIDLCEGGDIRFVEGVAP
jgi:hypothetical protein